MSEFIEKKLLSPPKLFAPCPNPKCGKKQGQHTNLEAQKCMAGLRADA